MSKSLLIISRHAPWSGPGAKEALDLALAGGAFDLPIGLLFMDDGVFQLKTQQASQALQQKDLTANLQALPLFGIDDIFVSTHSLKERGIDSQQLNLKVKSLENSEIGQLIQSYAQVITL